MEKIEMMMIIAAIKEKELWIPKRCIEGAKNLASPEAKLYFTFKAAYPTFKEVIL